MFLLYMATRNPDPFTNGRISTKIDDVDKMAYYILPVKFRLFRATKSSKYLTPDHTSLKLKPREFFGVYNMNPTYIESYENEYGIIFAFKTMRKYKLLALDHPDTKDALYKKAPENIKQILEKNYGYTMSGKRDSKLNSDLTLSQYLCDEGYEGYATNFMQTDTGEFQPEFMICDVGGIKPRGRVTKDKKIKTILEAAALNKLGRDLKGQKVRPVAPDSPVALSSIPFAYGSPGASYGSPGASSIPFAYGSPGASYDSPLTSSSSRGSNIQPKLFRGHLFADDSNNEDKFGGLGKRRSYKKKKTRTNKINRSIRRNKGTRRRR